MGLLERAAELEEVPRVPPREEVYLLPALPLPRPRLHPAPLYVVADHRVQLGLGEVLHLHRDEGVE